MYFPGDPLQPLDPIFNSISDESARNRLISSLDIEHTEPNYSLAYCFDIVLRGSGDTPFEEARR
jgi:protocatechuate 3,4-dioxygenase beta subunit